MIDNVIQVTTTSSHVRIYCCNNSDNRRDKCLVTLSSENSLVILAINKFHLHCTLLDTRHNASRAHPAPVCTLQVTFSRELWSSLHQAMSVIICGVIGCYCLHLMRWCRISHYLRFSLNYFLSFFEVFHIFHSERSLLLRQKLLRNIFVYLNPLIFTDKHQKLSDHFLYLFDAKTLLE